MTAGSAMLCLTPPPMQGPRRDPYTAEQLVQRLLRAYGARRVRRLVHDFTHNVPVCVSAARLGVNPRRAQEWRDMLGTTISAYVIHPDVQDLADEQGE